jgi:hypothetical protein
MNRHIALAAWVLVPGLSFADSPWLPEPGATDFTLSYLTQSTDEFFLGEMEASLPADFDQETIGVQFSYGISDRLPSVSNSVTGFRTGWRSISQAAGRAASSSSRRRSPMTPSSTASTTRACACATSRWTSFRMAASH